MQRVGETKFWGWKEHWQSPQFEDEGTEVSSPQDEVICSTSRSFGLGNPVINSTTTGSTNSSTNDGTNSAINS